MELIVESTDQPAPFGHFTPQDLSTRTDERTVCASFLYHPNEMARLWAAAVSGIENPGKALIRDERHRRLIGKILEYRRAMISRTNNPDPEMDFMGFLHFTGRDAWADMGGSEYITGHDAFFWSLHHTKQALKRLIDNFRVTSFQLLLEDAMESVNDQADLSAVIVSVTEKSRALLKADAEMITPTAEVCNNELDRKITEEDNSMDIPTTFREFAKYVGEYQRGQITLVGAPPGNGKTAWAMQEIETSVIAGFTADAFLMESSFRQFSDRWIMRNYAIRGSRFKTKSFTHEEMKALNDGMGQLTKFENRLFYAPMANYSVAKIDAMIQARKAATGLPCDLIVIDHLDTMAIDKQPGQSSYEARQDMMLGISDLAIRENAAVLLLSQLSVDAIRNSIGQSNKFPTIDAFRGGTPTEKAKVVVILNKDKQAMLDNNPVVEQQIVICKANDGQTGYIRSLFLKPFAMHIEDVSSMQRSQYIKWLSALEFPMDSKRKDSTRQ